MKSFHSQKFFAADDWGMSPAVNDAILQLARRGYLHSVSCIAGLPFTGYRADELRTLAANGLKLFLHFNLTHGRPLMREEDVSSLRGERGFHSHKIFLWRSLTGRIISREVTLELAAQRESLEKEGLTISGIDGHHHIHLLPGVWPAVGEALAATPGLGTRVMIDPAHPPSYLLTAVLRRWGNVSCDEIQECRYLLPSDLVSEKTFFKKLYESLPRPLIIHPSTEDDFDRHGVDDGLKAHRAVEFKKIMNYLG